MFLKNRCLRRLYSGLQEPVRIDLSDQILPRATGGGPFVDVPKFDPIESSGAIMSIQLPESGHLNIRTASIVALNGRIYNLEAAVSYLKPGMWYQSVRLNIPVSFLVSGGDRNYMLLDTQRDEKWIFENFDSVVAWSGQDLSVFLPLCKASASSSAFHCNGSGTIVIQSTLKPFKVNIDPGENILVCSSALLASNAPLVKQVCLQDDRRFSKLWTSLALSIKATFCRVYRGLSHYASNIYGISPAKLPNSVRLTKWNVGHSLKSSLLLEKIANSLKSFPPAPLRKGNRQYYKVEGPAKIIVAEQP